MDMEEREGVLHFSVSLNLESFLAGIDMDGLEDTDTAAAATDYDSLRALGPEALSVRFEAFWPEMAGRIAVQADGSALPLILIGVVIPEIGDVGVTRASILTFNATLPSGAGTVTVGWAKEYGTLILRQQGVDAPYTGYLEGGVVSEPIALIGGGEQGLLQTFLGYIPVGFTHILPKGLDHILFVLGLFFLSPQMRPLLWQITAFTAAHTVTLALGASGLVSVPSNIVEPIIALSIAYVAIENLFRSDLSKWRPVVVFCFGLLHGLGFASVLGEFGLPQGAFFPALIGFNIGVELGQLAVIATAFILLDVLMPVLPLGDIASYRRAIARVASALIAGTGIWMFIERVFL